MKKRILSILVICCMVLGLLPMTTFANNGGAKAIQLGTSGISGYDSTNSSYDYIYFGAWNSSPVKWRVLDTKTNMPNAQEGDGFFLLSDALLGTGEFGGVEFDYTTPYFNDWKGSRAQDWCNDFYSRSLSITEQKAVLATSKSDALYGMYYDASDNILDGDKVFFLSAEESENASYGFTDDNARIANYGDSAYVWWLRSPRRMNPDSAGTVNEKGAVIGEWVGQTNAARPAFNLKPDSVLLVSAAVGGKGTADGMFKIPEYSGDEWKLTLLDDTRTFRVTETTAAGKPGGTVTLNFSGPRTGLNEYISAIIEGESGATYYGRIMKPTATDRQLSFTLPHDLASGNYKLHVFSEQCNGDYQTDYASRFQTVALTVEEAATEQFALTPGGTYYFDLSGENIPGTINDDLPDKSMHYVPFTYAGAVNAYKLTSAMATTEEYAQQYKYDHSLFIADHAVTHTVSWDDLNTKSLIFGKDYVAGGVDYTLRAPSVGSNYTGSGNSERGVPQSNEWDTMLNKDSGYIQNWNKMHSLCQDAFSGDASRRAVRGYHSARYWGYNYATGSYSILGFRPILEVLNPDTLDSDGLKVVTLDLGGGTLGGSSEDIQIIVKNGESFTAPSDEGLPRPDGISEDAQLYWTDENGNCYKPGDTVPADVSMLSITGDYEVIYLPGTYGTGSAVTDMKPHNNILTLRGALFTRVGYTQVGWSTVDGGEKVYDFKDIYTKNEALTLYPVWNTNKYTITFDTNGGSEIAPITQDYGTEITAPDNPTRKGYTFKGWDKEIPETMPAENITVKAQWEINQYTITFDTNGGSEITPITQDYETAITAPDNPTRKGYTFKGWDKEIPETMPAENITVKAQWEINQYTITFDTNGGSEIAPITQDYGTEITAPDNPTRKGYTFKGWDKEIPETMPAENITVKAQWEINQYTITFDTNGGSEIAPITQDYGTEINAPDNPTRKGYTFKGWDKEIPETMPAENITITARWRDTEKPTGEIIIGTNKWNEFLNELTFGIFFKDTQEVTINAVDNSGVVFVSYLVTDKELSEAELNSLVFRAYEEPFSIDPNGEYIVYVMLVDENINITYLRSDRITLDNIQPVISGIENGKTYCEAQTVTVDEKYVDTVTVNGTAVTLDADGGFVLPPTNGEQKIVVTDKAGNNAEMTVTVNNGHTFGEWVSDNDGKHTRKCTVDGCDASETENCSGGNATCTEKAVCDVCGKAYGEPDGTNHKGGVQEWTTRTAFNHEQKWNCCGAVIVASEAHEWKDGVCRECGYVCLHNDADKDHICDYCKKTISEHVDKDKNHICDYCKKTISAHEDATPEEIKKPDTVTAKPDDSKSPQTGDNSNLILWIALLIISGGVMKGVTAFGKNKKHSAKIKDK